ncbi:hypothetical protein V8J36_19755 [Frigidibacter sp. MR17.14]|uniref:hypothetical protein n=1 Tax=Frigidibacter sp. MR17.14 TaxID=3126509 RepID=UPI003012FA6A
MTASRLFPSTGLGSTVFAAGRSGVRDLTARPRLGLRGRGTPNWCAAAGLPFPAEINGIARAGSIRVARLGTYELLVLSDDGLPIAAPAEPVPEAFDGYRDETWAWFRFEGPAVANALATMTAVDLRPAAAPAGRVLQTRFAGLDVVLVIDRRDPDLAVDLFFDIASVDYLLGAISDRAPELLTAA